MASGHSVSFSWVVVRLPDLEAHGRGAVRSTTPLVPCSSPAEPHLLGYAASQECRPNINHEWINLCILGQSSLAGHFTVVLPSSSQAFNKNALGDAPTPARNKHGIDPSSVVPDHKAERVQAVPPWPLQETVPPWVL